MNLSKELELCECGDTREEFLNRLTRKLQEGFVGMTIDDLVCSPSDAMEFCKQIRDMTECSKLIDPVILKALMNLRRAKNMPTGLKAKREPKRLQTQLNELGCDLTADTFRERANDLFAGMYKSRTFDELACHPVQAKDLCSVLRKNLGNSELPDSMILRTIMNVRKAGF